jgi:hypothetical protein
MLLAYRIKSLLTVGNYKHAHTVTAVAMGLRLSAELIGLCDRIFRSVWYDPWPCQRHRPLMTSSERTVFCK